MSKAVGSAVLALVLVTSALAQDRLEEAAAQRLKTQGEEMTRAFLKGDNSVIADYIYPRVVELFGGREKLIASVDKDMRDLRDKGFEPLSYVYSEPIQVVKIGPRTYAVVAATLRMKTPSGTYVSESYTIAITADGGANWKFVAASNVTPEQLVMLLPEIKGKLNIPKQKPITLEPLPEPTPAPSPTPAPTPTPTTAP